MIHLIESLKAAIESGNHYSILTQALTLPDIASKIDDPNEASGWKRYSKWFDKYIGDNYKSYLPKHDPAKQEERQIKENDFAENMKRVPQHLWGETIMKHIEESKCAADIDLEEHIHLTGKDCYALRCSFLHEGDMDIDGQRAQEYVNNFEFVMPQGGALIHCITAQNGLRRTLMLQVDIFGHDILTGVESWIESTKDDPVKMAKLNAMPKIGQLPVQQIPNYTIPEKYKDYFDRRSKKPLNRKK